MKLSRIITPHSKKCRVKGKKYEWSGIPEGKYWGNYAANPDVKRWKNHLWIKVLCNDPACCGVKAVNSIILAEA